MISYEEIGLCPGHAYTILKILELEDSYNNLLINIISSRIKYMYKILKKNSYSSTKKAINVFKIKT